MYPFSKSNEVHPRHELDSEGVVTNRWVPAAQPRTPKELGDLYKGIKPKDLDALDEFSRSLGQSIDAYLITDTDESKASVKQLIQDAKDWTITVYVGTQIHHILSAESKFASDPSDVGYFKKYRDRMVEFGKNRQLITPIAERFL